MCVGLLVFGHIEHISNQVFALGYSPYIFHTKKESLLKRSVFRFHSKRNSGFSFIFLRGALVFNTIPKMKSTQHRVAVDIKRIRNPSGTMPHTHL